MSSQAIVPNLNIKTVTSLLRHTKYFKIPITTIYLLCTNYSTQTTEHTYTPCIPLNNNN